MIFKPGEQHTRAKLNWDMVRFIRKSYIEDHMTMQQIADSIGYISISMVRLVIRGQHWKDPNYVAPKMEAVGKWIRENGKPRRYPRL